MENLFLKALDNSMSNKRTENGALSFNSSGNPVLDLFALGGAYRSRSDEDILALWRKAYAASPLDALLVLFYIRAAREGIGEKRFFRVAFADLLKSGKLNNEAAAELIALVPDAGSWKDLVSEPVFSSSPLVGEIIVKQLLLDSASVAPSLLAKWIPCGRGNESAKRETKRFSSLFSMSEKNYRKLVVGVRRKLSLVETRMAENRWNDIEYDKIFLEDVRVAGIYVFAFFGGYLRGEARFAGCKSYNSALYIGYWNHHTSAKARIKVPYV